MLKKKGCLIPIIIVAVLIIGFIVLMFLPDGESGTKTKTRSNLNIPNLREHYTEIAGDGSDKATIMVYMIGSDLESDGSGCASADIDEMLAADLGDNVNLVIQTGGTTDWVNPKIQGGVSQRFNIKNGELNEVANLGALNMVIPQTLSDFVSWATAEYPSTRNELIFWDHGAGTILGYGSDQYHEDDTLSLSEISKAIADTGVKFDAVGFDACLMGTIETAYMLEPYADYLIASEETEPGTGWYYTKWLEKLAKDPGMDTIDLGKAIIDDFVNGPDSSFYDNNTLSIIELREIPYTYAKLNEYLDKSNNVLASDYKKIAVARQNTKSYGDGEFEQIDISSYITQADIEGGDDLQKALESSVKYSDSSTSDSYGLAMYFPLDYPDYFLTVEDDISNFGWGGASKTFFGNFMSIMGGGQMTVTASQTSPVQSLTGNDQTTGATTGADTGATTQYSDYSWYNSSIADSYDYTEDDYSELPIIEKGDYFALQLSDDKWDTMASAELQVFVDDGEGYIDLGSDNVYEFDDDGDLKVEFDNTWVALNGQVVPFYAEAEEGDDKEWYSYGYVTAVLNDTSDIEIMIWWDNKHPDGYVAGYRAASDGVGIPSKGFKELKNGDKIDFVCDYYNYDGEYDDQYIFGDSITYDGKLEVSYEDVGDMTCDICFMLTDIYNNNFWTETVEYSY